jgi:hypothetical protein
VSSLERASARGDAALAELLVELLPGVRPPGWLLTLGSSALPVRQLQHVDEVCRQVLGRCPGGARAELDVERGARRKVLGEDCDAARGEPAAPQVEQIDAEEAQ